MYENSGARMRFKKRRKRGGSMNSFSRNSSISSSFISSFSNFSKTKKKNVNETERLINLAKQEKKKLKNFILDLNEQHKQGKISYLEYENKFDKVLKRKSPEYWLNYYDNYIKKQKVRLFPPRKEVKVNISHIFIILFISFIVLSIFLFGPSLQKTITGFFVAPSGFEEKSYIDDIDLVINIGQEYQWIPEHQGQLLSLKLNGKIIGDGSVKIWLEDKLIYSNEPNVPVSITGAAVETLGMPEEVNETNITRENITNVTLPEEPIENITNITEPVPEPIVKEIILDNICLATCDLADLALNQESYKIIIEIDNAVLKLDSFSYTIFEEIEEIPTIPTDITFVPTVEIAAEIANATFTPSTKTVCDENNRCTLTLYSTVRYVKEDGNWIEIEDSTVDLKPYFIKEYLEKDPNFDIDIIQLNYTFIDLNFSFNWENWINIPECSGNPDDIKCNFKFSKKWEETDEEGTIQKYEEKFQYKWQLKNGEIKESTKWNLKGNPFMYTYSFGGNSTEIKLVAVDSENLEDTNILEETPDTAGGALTEFHLLAESGINRQDGIIKYNISSIPAGSTVEEAMFYAYMNKENIDNGEAFHADAHHLYNLVWTEDVLTWNIAATYSYNTTSEARWTCTGADPNPDAPAWVNWTVTDMLINATESNHNNVSIWIRSTYSAGGPAGNDDVEFNTKENLNFHPYLNVTYSPPSDVNPPTVYLYEPINNSNQSSISVTFNCSAYDPDPGLNNITLYGNWTAGIWHANETQERLGTEENSTLFTKNIEEGTYIWNCYACDQLNNCQFNDTNFTLSIESVAPIITDASINDTTPVDVDTIVKVNASIIDSAGHLDNVSLTVIPPSGVGYNTSVENTGDEWYNETIKLDVSGKWQFKWWANDTYGNNATAVYAQDGNNNLYINASNGPQFTNYEKNETIVGSGKFIKFNVSVTDGDGISLVNGTVDDNDVDFIDAGADNEWYYQWGPCSSSDTQVDFTYVSGNDTMDMWNSTSVPGIVAECDAVAPSAQDEGANETQINENEWFCVNITVSDTEGNLDKVLANVWDTTQFINYTMTDTGSTTCDVGSGDGIYGIEIQGTNTGYWNYSRIYVNDTGGNLNTYVFANNLTIEVVSADNYPEWSNPQKNKTDVYQNDYINFSTDWTDDNPLSSFMFSINYSSGGWKNSTWIAFDVGISSNATQITVPFPTNVSWRFYANDSTDQINITAIQTFLVAEHNVTWNTTLTKLGSAQQGDANLSVPSMIFLNGSHIDVDVGCLSGDCNTIATNWTKQNVKEGEKEVYFNCTTVTAGNFSTLYYVNSTEDTTTNNMTVTCNITGVNQPPTHDIPLLNSTFGTNLSSENLTCYNQSTSDPNSDAVTNIYQWYVNNISMAVLIMPFDTNISDVGANVKDYSGNSNNGTRGGTTEPQWISEGKIGGVYNFSGDDYITLDDASSLDGDGAWGAVSVEAWVKTDSDQSATMILAKWGVDGSRSYQIGFDGSGTSQLFWGIDTGAAYLETLYSDVDTLSIGTWYHIIGTYEGTTGVANLYINGDFNATNSNAGGNVAASSGSPFRIGARNPTPERFFIGSIDEVRIYNYSMTAQQILQRYLETKDGYSNNATIVSQETTADEEWKCRVIPNDATFDGIPKNSTPLTIIAATEPYNDIIFNSTFDQGNLVNGSIQYQGGDADGKRDYTAEVNYTTAYGFTEKHWWFYYSMENVTNKTVQVNITNVLTIDITEDRWTNIEPVYSFDNDTWYRLPSSNYSCCTDNIFSVTLSMNDSTDKVWIAPIYPYPTWRVKLLEEEFASSLYLNVTNLGLTPLLNMNLTQFVITDFNYSDSNKKKVYIIAQQHAGETPGSWVADGMIRFLLNETNTTAARIRRNFIFKIIPIINVEGVYMGISRYTPVRFSTQQDLNRDWDDANIDNLTSREVNLTFMDIKAWMPDAFSDLHSTVNNESLTQNHTDCFFYSGNSNTITTDFMNNVSTGKTGTKDYWPETGSRNVGGSFAAPYNVYNRIGINPSVSQEHPHDNRSSNTLHPVDHNPQNLTDWKDWGKKTVLGIYDYYGENYPNVTLNEPENDSDLTSNPITFNCSAELYYNELDNITLYGAWLGGWHANTTNEVIGTSNTTTFELNISDGTYVWNCYSCSEDNGCSFAPTNYTFDISTGANQAPRIENISVINDTDPNEAQARDIRFTFTVYDAQGTGTINAATIKVNLSVSGSEKNVSRYNNTCVEVGDLDSYTTNFSCAIDLWYWDPDTEWNVTINISDTGGLESTNETMWFNYTTLTAIQLGPSSLGFGSISPGASNNTAASALTLNNTGNDFDLSIQINTSGLWNQTKYIAAENFTVDIETGASNPECDIGGGATVLQNGTWTTIVGAILLRGNNTAELGQEQLYFCLTNVSTTLPSQDYTTEEKGPWWIKILLVAVLPAAGVLSKKKKKKKQKQKQKSKQDLEPTKEKLLKIFEINNEDLRKYEELKEKYNLSAQDVLNLIEIRKLKEKEKRIKEIGLTIPISLLKKDKKSKLGPAETLVKYLKENLGLRLSEIARILKRDQRTIWLTYNNARKKKKEKIIVKKEKLSIPISILKNRKISILESIIIYLKEKGFSNIEIASLLNRDVRNIYTLASRAKDKLKENKEKK